MAEGLSRTELQVLLVVTRADGITPRTIGDELKMTSSNVAATLRALESAGLVLRQKDHGDARRVNVSATSAGIEMVAHLRRERDTWLGHAIATQLSAEEFEILARAGDLMERLSRFEPLQSAVTVSAHSPVVKASNRGDHRHPLLGKASQR